MTFRVAVNPTIPAGRTFTHVAWVLDDGSTQLGWSGNPDLQPTVSNVTGLNKDALIDDVSAGLTGTVAIQATITDSNGSTAILTASKSL